MLLRNRPPPVHFQRGPDGGHNGSVAQRQRGTMAATPMLGLIKVHDWLDSEYGHRDKLRMRRDCVMCSLVSGGSKDRENGFWRSVGALPPAVTSQPEMPGQAGLDTAYSVYQGANPPSPTRENTKKGAGGEIEAGKAGGGPPHSPVGATSA